MEVEIDSPMHIPRNRLIVYGVLYVGAMLIVGGLIAFAVARPHPAAAPLTAPLESPAPQALPSLMAASPTAELRVIPTATESAPPSTRMASDSTPVPTFTPKPTAAGPCGAAPDGYEWHFVRRGETLVSIAAQHGTTVNAIRNANRDRYLGLRWSNLIHPRDCLLVPE